MALYDIEKAVCISTVQRNSNKFYGIIVYRNKFFAVFIYHCLNIYLTITTLLRCGVEFI